MSANSSKPVYQLKPVLVFFLGIFSLGLLGFLIYPTSKTGTITGIEWMLACLISGILVGFLFGIPKTLQNPPASGIAPANTATTAGTPNATPTPGGNYQQLVNTNLTEISDWLTKIIVGLGLVQLNNIPSLLYRTASALAAGLNGGATSSSKVPDGAFMALAYGIIICYVITGFLFGYLSTRLYLAGAFSNADQESTVKISNMLNANAAKIDNLAANQSLINNAVYTQPAAQAPAGQSLAAPIDPLDALQAQATQYMNISDPDYGKRIQLKSQAVDQMSNFAIKNNISKDDIFNLDPAGANEGLVITLATLVNAHPEQGDLDKLLKMGAAITRKHVQYRVLVAVSSLVANKLIGAADKPRIQALIDSYKANADKSLLVKIDSVTQLLKNCT